jgi:SAM-dependent methyltransferase
MAKKATKKAMKKSSKKATKKTSAQTVNTEINKDTVNSKSNINKNTVNIAENINHDLESSYDDIPYNPMTFPMTGPEYLSAVGRLFGIDTAYAQNAKILDIGCAQGLNPMSFAYYNPTANVVGIDMSQKQIEQGRALAKELGIQNVRLLHGDIASPDDPLKGEKFDFIVCHGVFNWVPPSVSHAILEYIRNHLSKNGIAYISYNAMPGWHRMLPLRSAIQHNAKHYDGWRNKIQATLDYVDALAENNVKNSIQQTALQMKDRMKTMQPSYIFHEYIEGDNHPLLLSEFSDMANEHGLKYLCDAHLRNSFVVNAQQKLNEIIQKGPKDDRVYMEQAFDFINDCQFKCSLIIHEEQEINHQLSNQNLRDLYFRVEKQPKAEDLHDLSFGDQWNYPSFGLSLNHRLHAFVMEHILRAFPHNISLTDIEALIKAQNVTPSADPDDPYQILGILRECTLKGVLQISTKAAAPITQEELQRPTISDFNRLLVNRVGFMVNPYHRMVGADQSVRLVSQFCDGRTAQEIFNALIDLWQNSKLNIQDQNKQAITDQNQAGQYVQSMVQQGLQYLQAQYLLQRP